MDIGSMILPAGFTQATGD